MSKALVIFVALAVVFITESSCQHIIHPTYRPPPRRPPVIRTARDVDGQTQWLWQGDNIPRAPATGDHPFLPSPYVDDIKLDHHQRYARSYSTPSRGGHRTTGSGSRPSGGRDTGPTHPGYNRRNARDVDGQPQWLWQGDDIPRAPATGDHPFLPSPYVDDIKLDLHRRYARSYSTPSRGGHRTTGSGSRPSGGRDTGPTHPGYNRRNARDVDGQPQWLWQGDDIPRAPATGDHPFLPSPYVDDIKLDPNRRYARDVDGQPQWLWQGDNIPRAPATVDHPFLPSPYVDDIKLDPHRRYARSYSTPSRGGHRTTGSGSRPSGGRDTGPTHPGYNRRNARDVDDQPQWLWQGDDIPRAPATGDHPFLPSPYVDDIKLDPHRRYARSYSTPSRGGHRTSGSGSRPSGGRDTGPTHPGYNRRNARSVPYPSWSTPPFNPRPGPIFPKPSPTFPITDRTPRFPVYV